MPKTKAKSHSNTKATKGTKTKKSDLGIIAEAILDESPKVKSKTQTERENFDKAQARFERGDLLDQEVLTRCQRIFRENKSRHGVVPNMKLENALHYVDLDLKAVEQELRTLQKVRETILKGMKARSKNNRDNDFLVRKTTRKPRKSSK